MREVEPHEGHSDLLAVDRLQDDAGGAGGNDGFSHLGGSVYSKDVSVGTMIGGCPSAAFAETPRVHATAQNGYNRLSGYDAFASAGFALTPEVPAHPGPGTPGPPSA